MARKRATRVHIRTIDPKTEALWAIPTLIPQWIPIFTTIAVKALGGFVSFYFRWPSVGAVLLVSAGWLSLIVWLVRRHRLSWMLCDEELHALTHQARDSFDAIRRCRDEQALHHKIEKFELNFVNAVSGYFCRRLHNDSIGCCVRLVSVHDGKQAYVTCARSRNLGVERAETSEPISEDSGFVLALKQRQSLGVWILNDLREAVETQLWPELKNNDLDHFDSMMIAPVNTVIDGTKSMAGILFVTAKGRVFERAHSAALKAFADYLGAAVPFLYNDSDAPEPIAATSTEQGTENDVRIKS